MKILANLLAKPENQNKTIEKLNREADQLARNDTKAQALQSKHAYGKGKVSDDRPICLEGKAEFELVTLGCRDKYCATCLRNYLFGKVKERVYPIRCPTPTCKGNMTFEECTSLLAGCGDVFDIMQQLDTMHRFMDQQRFCAYDNCKAVFDFEAGTLGSETEYQVECAECQRLSCARCKVPWHEGLTCGAFMALPPEMRLKPADAALLRLAHAQQWKACPKCGEMVEKRADSCNFVTCKCATGFCYRCGKAYLDTRSTRQNAHGVPGCACGLWTYEDDPESEEEDDAWDPPPRPQPLQPNYRPPPPPLLVDMRLHARVLDLARVMSDARAGRNRLPNGIFNDLRLGRCHYCGQTFGSLAALEEHLLYDADHEVYYCCGRTFIDAAGLRQHQLNKGRVGRGPVRPRYDDY